MVSSAYMRLLVFLLEILIPACPSSNPVYLMMYSAYKLNKQGDNIRPWYTPFLIWSQSVVQCPVLTIASWSEYRFLMRRVRWSSIPICLRIFHSLLWSTQSDFGIVNKVKIDVFLELSCFSNDPSVVSRKHIPVSSFRVCLREPAHPINVFLGMSTFWDWARWRLNRLNILD